MNVRKTLLAISLAGSLAAPLAAYARVDIDVDVAPPAAIVETAPPREGYVYTPGYWQWDASAHRHNWVKGDYVPARRGEHWVPHEWRNNNGKYHFNEGHWEHDHGQ
jgi:hypothetical protein